MTNRLTRGDAWTAVALAAAMFVVFNANGREIGSYDSQPTKFAARELLLRGSLSLNYVIGAIPLLAERSAFVHTLDGGYHSAYSPVPSILAAGVFWPLSKLRIVDLQAPLAPTLISAVGAAFISAIAVALTFVSARQRLTRRGALMVAIALGVGTGIWCTVSQTLWQHESAILGLAIAMVAFAKPQAEMTMTDAIVTGLGLGVAGASRPQISPIVAILLIGTFVRAGWRRGALAALAVSAFALPLVMVNERWFGTPLGAAPMLETLHRTVHGTNARFRFRLDGLAGLLISPNRGLFIFSPVVLVSAFGLKGAIVDGWRSPLRWCVLAACAQFVLYGSYPAWWAGHTYGPRYMLDVLPLLVPLAAAGLATPLPRPVTALAIAALAWSIVTTATGAFYYPNDGWNSDPEVDRNHERLWDWSDTQIRRAWHNGPSPQNFSLLTRDAFRRPTP